MRGQPPPASAPPNLAAWGPVPAVGRPPAQRLEMDVEPSASPAPLPPRRWGRQEAMKRQPRKPPLWLRGPLFRKERLPEMSSVRKTLASQATVMEGQEVRAEGRHRLAGNLVGGIL